MHLHHLQKQRDHEQGGGTVIKQSLFCFTIITFCLKQPPESHVESIVIMQLKYQMAEVHLFIFDSTQHVKRALCKF